MNFIVFKYFFLVICVNVPFIHCEDVVNNKISDKGPIPCTCGIFLSGQFDKNSKEQPKGNAAIIKEFEKSYAGGHTGVRQCTNKCLDAMIKHLPNSPAIICGTLGRDCYKEKAHLFIKNDEPSWKNTKLSAGREYCCKNSRPYKCPL